MKITYRQALKTLPEFTKEKLMNLFKQRSRSKVSRSYARDTFLDTVLNHIENKNS